MNFTKLFSCMLGFRLSLAWVGGATVRVNASNWMEYSFGIVFEMPRWRRDYKLQIRDEGWWSLISRLKSDFEIRLKTGVYSGHGLRKWLIGAVLMLSLLYSYLNLNVGPSPKNLMCTTLIAAAYPNPIYPNKNSVIEHTHLICLTPKNPTSNPI